MYVSRSGKAFAIGNAHSGQWRACRIRFKKREDKGTREQDDGRKELQEDLTRIWRNQAGRIRVVVGSSCSLDSTMLSLPRIIQIRDEFQRRST